MANYTIPENPQYTTEIRKLQNTDPANAEAILNPLLETLIENTHAVKFKADHVDDLQEQVNSQQAEIDGKAAASHSHTAGDIDSGTLPIACGGTGQTTAQGIRNALGLGNTTGAVPIANGGTGQTTVAGVRNALGLGNTTGAVPIANGGTGATSAPAAVTALGLGKNLTFTGAVTGTYNGQAAKTVFIPDRKGFRFVVGTSTAGHTAKDCDYLCDGTADQVEIQAAINALPSGGGEIVLLDGTYNIAAPINLNKNNVFLNGCGNGAVLNKQWNSSFTLSGAVIYVTQPDCYLKHLSLVGNKSAYPNGIGVTFADSGKSCIMDSVQIIDFKLGVDIDSVGSVWVIHCVILDCSSEGLLLNKALESFILGCVFKRNEVNNIRISGATNRNNVIANNCISNGQKSGTDSITSAGGISLENGIANVVSGNTFYCCNTSIKIAASVTNTNISGNSIQKTNTGIEIAGGCCSVDHNIITDSQTYSIRTISGSVNNLISNNLIFGKNYTASGGTGNAFVNNKYN